MSAAQERLTLRAADARRLVKHIVRDTYGAPNIIDGAVPACTFTDQAGYFEAASRATAASGGRLHVVEIKSFPITDGRCDNEKLGAACDQAAWYVLHTRRTSNEERLQPNVISDQGCFLVPEGVRLKLCVKAGRNRITARCLDVRCSADAQGRPARPAGIRCADRASCPSSNGVGCQ